MKNALRLKRICPGNYETVDGRFQVIGFQRPEKCDYGPAGQWRWYYRELPYGDVHDHFDTKSQAVEALKAQLDYEAIQFANNLAQLLKNDAS